MHKDTTYTNNEQVNCFIWLYMTGNNNGCEDDIQKQTPTATARHQMPAPPPLQGQGDVRARIFKLLRGPGIDSKDSIPPAYAVYSQGGLVRQPYF